MRRESQFRFALRSLAGSAMALALALGASPAQAACPDLQGTNLICNGTDSGIPVAPGFLFEPEVPFTSLKNVPTWNELEQMLDNPYAMVADPATPPNEQGYPSYRATVVRRPGFGVVLPNLLVHPLNFNTTTGEEMRIVNFAFPATNFQVTADLVQTGPTTYTWQRRNARISAGSTRVEPGSIPIDYNNPVAADPPVCVLTTEFNPPEGSTLCGGDPGEPRYNGFSVFNAQGYSTPAIRNVPSETAVITGIGAGDHRLYDPTPDVNGVVRGFINSRNATTGVGGLRKPSLRVPENGGTPAAPNYVLNVDPDAVTASSENDFIRDRNVAAALGKALFWDMQVGSDNVQSCGSCHFNGTGTDTRTKNQLNPNHIGGDNTLQIGDALLVPGNPLAVPPVPADPAAGKAANYTLKPSDFPLVKLANPDIAGDPACSTPLVANTSAAIAAQAALIQPGTPTVVADHFFNPVSDGVTVCSAANALNDVRANNDVVSSMGVHWGIFKDIQIGLQPAADHGVSSVLPDLRETAADCATILNPDPLLQAAAQAACLAAISDPIAAFRGAAGANPLDAGVLNEFRRVEPRNTPTMQAAGFNFDNFWDGRARHDFNGGSVFGAADPQTHVWVDAGGTLTPTRQVIRFVSLASLATGPGLSEFEMSFAGRNWSKIGKKLLQAGALPLANQLVDPNDSLLGPYSNQRTSGKSPLCTVAGGAGKPGLCASYNTLIAAAFYPALHSNTSAQLVGCYTDGRTEIHPNQCGTAPFAAASVRVLNHNSAVGPVETVIPIAADPFDNYVLSVDAGAAAAAGPTNTFTQMEGNFSLFWGLSVQTWVNLLVPDHTPFDQFLDANPGAFAALGEPGEAGLVNDLLNCGQSGADPNYCFTEVGNFKRDPNAFALRNPTGENGVGGRFVRSGGTRSLAPPIRGVGGATDPLLGMDIFNASNLSLKNPMFRTGRCGECHAIPTLTDHTMPFTSKINLMDAVFEFSTPGVELILEPLGRLRVITGFLLESELNENGQDAVERRIVDQSIVPSPVDGLAYPGGTADGPFGPWTGADSAFLDNGMYNLGIRPTHEDIGRGGNDAFGWPLSLATLMMKNLAGEGFNPGGNDASNDFAQPAAPGIPLPTFDAGAGITGGLFEETAQDQQINPGFEGEPAVPMLPSYLGDFVNNITVGDFPPELDEAGGAIGGMVNTLTDIAMIEGFMDTLGPFNPGNIAAEVLNAGGHGNVGQFDSSAMMGTWPNANRVGRMGSFKAAPLRNVELTGPYFHNGGKLTLRQVVDFYTRGGDFPISNKAHRDFNLVNMNVEIQSNLSEAEKVALVDYLLELTDERNRFDRAPFDHPQVIVASDGLAPDNTLGRTNLLSLANAAAGPCVAAHGAVDPVTGLPVLDSLTGLQVIVPASGACFMDVRAVGATGRPLTATPGDELNTGPEPMFMNLTKVRLTGAAANDPRVAGNPPNPECDYDGRAGTGRISQYCH